jgi:hypothetical protein
MSMPVAQAARNKDIERAEKSLQLAIKHLARGANFLATAEQPVLELEADKLMRLVMALRAKARLL